MNLATYFLLCGIAVVSSRPRDSEEEDHPPPRVAWVPIMTRNVTADVRKALVEEGSNEKLTRISTMLDNSYDRWNKDAKEGDHKIRELENRLASSSSVVTISFTFLFAIIFS